MTRIIADARKVSPHEFLDAVGPLFGMPVRRTAEQQAERERLCREHQSAMQASYRLASLEEGMAERARLTAEFDELVAAGKTERMLLPADEDRVRSVNERDLKRTIEINEGRANAAAQHRVTRQSASPVPRSRPSGRVPTFAKEKRA